MKAFTGIIAVVVLCAALNFAGNIFAPVAFALFVIAVGWPLQAALQKRLPKMAAVLLTVVVTLALVSGVCYAVVWGFGHVAKWVFANGARFQAIYGQLGEWLEQHGFVLGTLVTEHFDMRFVFRIVQDVSGRLQGLFSFLVVTFVYVLLGLLEVDAVASQLRRMKAGERGAYLVAAASDAAVRLQKYMKVRTLMSIATGVVVWLFTLTAGLELALAWGTLAFGLNYIPFLGPFVATLLPTFFALAQFESWQMALFVFVCLNVIQFLSGSYIEPRIAGKTLAMSPFLVLFSVFFGAFLWGISGAFIGVPVTIVILTFLSHHPATRDVANILSGTPAPAPAEVP